MPDFARQFASGRWPDIPNQVRVGVGVAGAKQASSELDHLRDKFDKLQKQGAKGFVIGAGAAITATALGVVGNAISDVTGFLGESVRAYQEQEVATTRLNASLKANVAGWQENAKGIKAVDEAGIKLGFDNTDTENSLALLVAATHDYGEALRVLGVAQDLARFKGISLQEASEALTKVEAGSFRVLKSLGIQLKDGATQAEALAAVEKVAGNQAREFARTDLGQLQIAYAKVQDAQEKFGEALSHLEADILPGAADALGVLAGAVHDLTHLTEQEDPETWAAGIAGQFANVSLDGEKVVRTVGRVTAAATMARKPWADLSKIFKTSAEYANDLEGEIHDLANTIVDELYGDVTRAGKEADLQQELKDLRKEYDDTERSFSKRRVAGEIARVRGELFLLHLEEAEKAGPQAAIDFLKKEGKNAGLATDEIQALIKKYQQLSNLQGELGPIIVPFAGGPKSHAQKKQHGGPVKADEAYIVGEEGEELFVPNTNGRIIPNGGSGSAMPRSGGSITTIPIPVPMNWTPSMQAAWASEAGPAMVDYFRRRGLV